MRWETLALVTTLFSAGLAGCVKPYPDEPECWDGCCEDCGYCPDTADCCLGCGSPPPRSPPTPPPTPPPWQPPVCPTYESYSAVADRADLSCAVPPTPPILDVLVPTRLYEGCEGCEHASLASDSMRAFVATEDTLIVAEEGRVEAIGYPTERLERPHVSVDGGGRAWIVGIERSGALARVVLLVHRGASDLDLATLDVVGAPILPLVERAHVVPAQGGAVVVLVGGGGAWASRWDGTQFGAIERLTPVGGDSLVGAPAVDLLGQFAIPFAFTPRDAIATIGGALMPQVQPTSLHYLAMNSDGTWSTYGGAVVPKGVAAPPVVEIRSGVAAFLYVDREARLHRIETQDEGMSWGAPAEWGDPGRSVRGSAAAMRELYTTRATAAWWEDDGGMASLVVARTDGSPTPVARREVTSLERAPEAALALFGDGRAVVAWVDEEGGVWAALEGGRFPRDVCDDAAHCAPARYRY